MLTLHYLLASPLIVRAEQALTTGNGVTTEDDFATLTIIPLSPVDTPPALNCPLADQFSLVWDAPGTATGWTAGTLTNSYTAAGVPIDITITGDTAQFAANKCPRLLADLTALKSVEVYDPENAGLYMTPGNEVLYRITVENSASAGADAKCLLNQMYYFDRLKSSQHIFALDRHRPSAS